MAKLMPGGSRRDRGMLTRQRMLESALGLFTKQGYAGTTMAQIAEKSGVAVQTVYFSFRTKGMLLIAVVEFAAAGGHDQAPTSERPWFREIGEASDRFRAIALLAEYGTDIYARMRDLAPTINAASSDPDFAAYWGDVAERRYGGMLRVVETLSQRGWLRPALSTARAADMLSAVQSHETYLYLTVARGWALEEFKAWSFITLCDQLLVDGHKVRSANAVRAATRDLSFSGLLSSSK